MSLSGGWTELNLGATSGAVEGLEKFKTQLQGLIGTAQTIVNITKTIADFVINFYIDLENVEVEVLRSAVGLLRDAIQELTESAGAYALFVPMHVVDPDPAPGDPELIYLGNRDALWFPFLEFSTGPAFINRPDAGSAGNFGFYQTVADSLSDSKDIMRPQFDGDAYVASAVLLFGADTFMDLVLLAKKLMRLFKLPGISLDNAVIPTPRNLRARLVPTPLTGEAIVDQYYVGDGDFSTQPHSVRLEWDPDEKDWLLTAYGNVRFEIREFVVNRWEDGKYTRSQILAGAAPATEILREAYDGVGLVIDRTISETGKTYWYSVGYLIDVLDDDGNVTNSYSVPLDITTAQVTVPKNVKLGPRHGIPPDWYPAPLFSLIPGLKDALLWLVDWLTEFEASLSTGKGEIEKFLEFLQRELDRYAKMANDIAAVLSELIDALTWPNVYAGIWVMKPGKGGNAYFLYQLAQALFVDSNKPPFEKGTEAVTGVVLYTGSNTAGKIEKFINSIDLLFGNLMSSRENALQEALDSLRALEEDLERNICLTQGLIETECTGTETTPPAIGKNLYPSNESTSCADAGTESVT